MSVGLGPFWFVFSCITQVDWVRFPMVSTKLGIGLILRNVLSRNLAGTTNR